MRLLAFVMLILISAPLSGCIEVLEPITVDEDGTCVILDAGRTSDGVLRILTYDIAAFSEEMMGAFENQTGYKVELIKADDSGGILEQLLQTHLLHRSPGFQPSKQRIRQLKRCAHG